MAKPTENLDWATNGTSSDILEPTAGQRTSGIVEGGTWTRRRLNWMFNGLGKWIDYLRDEVLEAGTGGDQARTNDQNDERFLIEADTIQTTTINAASDPNSGDLDSGSMTVVRVGNLVTITGSFAHLLNRSPSSSSNFVPSWAQPTRSVLNAYASVAQRREVIVNTSGTLRFEYSSDEEFTDPYGLIDFTITYSV
jgi:hypothetical protein